jgi:hypothetical protein
MKELCDIQGTDMMLPRVLGPSEGEASGGEGEQPGSSCKLWVSTSLSVIMNPSTLNEASGKLYNRVQESWQQLPPQVRQTIDGFVSMAGVQPWELLGNALGSLTASR